MLFAAAAASAAIHPAIALLYEAQRAPTKPQLQVVIDHEDAGDGVVVSSPDGISCGERCGYRYDPGTMITLTATVGEKSTFVGWAGPCGPQSYRLFRWAGEVLGQGSWLLEHPELYTFLAERAARPLASEPLECTVRLDHSQKVTATFGEQPDAVEVAWMNQPDLPPLPDQPPIKLPDPTAEAEALVRPIDAPPEKEPPKPPPDKPIELAVVEPPPPNLVQPTPPPPPPPPPPPKKQEIETAHLKSVEVPDEHVVDKAPDDAAFLSDKNRDVSEQTVAKDTNLDKQSDGKQVASAKSDRKSDEVGGEKEKVAELEATEASTLDPDRNKESTHDGKDQEAIGQKTGDEGDRGVHGDEGSGQPSEQKGLLSMRGIEGRGAPGGPVVEGEGHDGGHEGTPGDGGKIGRTGKPGRRGIKTQLEFKDYERIVGKDKADEEVKLAQRKQSVHEGRWEKKLAAIRSSLENFTPEVRTGNQTALKTRAAPFAVYIARMHRKIHELWGFGFLEELDDKPASNPMNDWTLWTKIEIVLNDDGTVDKTTIVRGSGLLTFDVAALDVVQSAAPYDPPPKEIHSADGKTYVHWSFHRDWQECGTFGAEPFILTTPRKDQDKGMDDGSLLGRVPGHKPAAGASEPSEPSPGGDGDGTDAAAASARAASHGPAPDDPEASFTANLWLAGFTHGDVNKMLKVSAVPFVSAGQVVANSGSEVAAVYKGILEESRSGVLRDWKLVSAAGYRKLFGALPEGLDADGTEVFMVVRLAKEQFTLVLKEAAQSRQYKVIGFYR